MSRYIDADKIIDYFIKVRKITVARTINKYPTADVVEIKHGEWHKISNNDWGCIDGYQCSECGDENLFPDWVMDEEENLWLEIMKFCPHCGAKMDGERKEDG